MLCFLNQNVQHAYLFHFNDSLFIYLLFHSDHHWKVPKLWRCYRRQEFVLWNKRIQATFLLASSPPHIIFGGVINNEFWVQTSDMGLPFWQTEEAAVSTVQGFQKWRCFHLVLMFCTPCWVRRQNFTPDLMHTVDTVLYKHYTTGVVGCE